MGDLKENVGRMSNIIKDFLDVSQIEEKRLKLKKESTNLEKLIKEIVKALSPMADARNCKISLKVKNKIPVLKLDKNKIEQVIRNILNNAISYSSKKNTISISLEKRKNDVLISCSDNGIGISKKEEKNIFKKFYRSEKAMMLSTEGTGLGLFISKAIIKQSNGKIWFKSEKDKGTVFFFTLPIK